MSIIFRKSKLIITVLIISIAFNIFLYFKLIDKPSDFAENGVNNNGQLSVDSTNIVNKNKDIFRLKGMSSHGLMWYPEYINTRSLNTIRGYGANALRIAMYTDQDKGYVYNKKESMKILLQSIENVLGADMYAIVDWHTLKDDDPNIYIEEAKGFFDEISKRYKDEPGIIYEIFNEPSGDTSWEDIKKYSNEIIPIIRKNSPNSIILVGTPNYCTDTKSVINDPLEYENILYTYHMYTGSSDGGYKYLIDKALENGIPMFVSEWGLSEEDNTNEIDYDKGRDFLEYLKEKNISWINWSLSNKDEAYSFINNDSDKLSNWNEEDLTSVGEFIKKSLSKY